MRTEDQVVDAVCKALTGRGYEITGKALATERGFDIVASNGEQTVVIEAKGGGSSKPGTARFGKTFSGGQVFDHFAKAVLKALRVTSAGEHRGGVAFPDDELHRREYRSVENALARAEIAVFFVGEDGSVDVNSPFQL